eukprot:TRINITY_DN26751_c0_g1_i3.p2 TRINITY_DN26751_c0_g1~~TRINITY_DN26751_c0_g1_i3.p2  ORF type:complete len:111 (+),score=24.80 TRINITY_DN26751_c0_g1_i3:214-546(+)
MENSQEENQGLGLALGQEDNHRGPVGWQVDGNSLRDPSVVESSPRIERGGYLRLGRESTLPRAGSGLSRSSSSEVLDRTELKRASVAEVEKHREQENIDDLLEVLDLGEL